VHSLKASSRLILADFPDGLSPCQQFLERSLQALAVADGASRRFGGGGEKIIHSHAKEPAMYSRERVDLLSGKAPCVIKEMAYCT